MAERSTSPGGFVVVLFGSAAEEWCSLNRCPMGLVKWFASHDEAKRYAEVMPGGFEPHVLMVEPDLTPLVRPDACPDHPDIPGENGDMVRVPALHCDRCGMYSAEER